MRTTWGNDSMNPNNFSSSNLTQVKWPIFDNCTLCGFHAYMNIRPILFTQGGEYYNGNFKGNETFEGSV